MIYHAENHYGHAYGTAGVTAFYASIGIARSADGGKTWSRQGPVITGREAQTGYPPPNIGLGAGNPSAIVTSGYIYVFYIDNVSRTGQFRGINSLCLARAPIATDGKPGSWTKYYQKSFSQPGIAGLCQAPVPPPSAKSGVTFQSNPDISFNSALNAFLLVFQSDDGFFYATSSDMVSWSPPRLFMSTPPNLQGLRTPGAEYYYYPLLVTPSATSDQLRSRRIHLLRQGHAGCPAHSKQSFMVSAIVVDQITTPARDSILMSQAKDPRPYVPGALQGPDRRDPGRFERCRIPLLIE
jgi:hypothetical protein